LSQGGGGCEENQQGSHAGNCRRNGCQGGWYFLGQNL
jgi:hypothetical protein